MNCHWKQSCYVMVIMSWFVGNFCGLSKKQTGLFFSQYLHPTWWVVFWLSQQQIPFFLWIINIDHDVWKWWNIIRKYDRSIDWCPCMSMSFWTQAMIVKETAWMWWKRTTNWHWILFTGICLNFIPSRYNDSFRLTFIFLRSVTIIINPKKTTSLSSLQFFFRPSREHGIFDSQRV